MLGQCGGEEGAVGYDYYIYGREKARSNSILGSSCFVFWSFVFVVFGSGRPSLEENDFLFAVFLQCEFGSFSM